MVKVSEKICDILIEAGIKHVFGIPGGGMVEIWDSLAGRQDKIKTILVRHEQAASCMADMYGRLTGKPAVLIGQGPFVSSTGSFGIMEAFLSYSPMLVLTDTSDTETFSQHGVYQCGTGEYGTYDQIAKLKSISKYVTYAVTPKEVIHGVQLGIKHATSGNFGPSCVVMRNAAINAEVNPTSIPRIYPTNGYLKTSLTNSQKADIDKVVALLLKAKFPVAIAGNGVHNSKAYMELRQLSELLGMPVATTMKGKSAFPEVHPLAAGMMGSFGQKIANNTIADADVLLVLGSRLSPNDTMFESSRLIDPLRQKIIQLDIDSRNAGWTYPVAMSVIGHLKPLLKDLFEAVVAKLSEKSLDARQRTESFRQRKIADGYFEAPELSSDTIPILPQRLVHEISLVATPDTIVTVDAGSNKHWMNHFFQTKEVGTYFGPGGTGGMGWGAPAALAAKIVYPEKSVISVAGDGGFMMMLHVLSTAVQYRLPLTFVVMNDSTLNMVQDELSKDKSSSVNFTPTDFSQIASAFGCRGLRVEKAQDIGPTLKEAIRAEEPTVVDVVTSHKESILKIINGDWGKPDASK